MFGIPPCDLFERQMCSSENDLASWSIAVMSKLLELASRWRLRHQVRAVGRYLANDIYASIWSWHYFTFATVYALNLLEIVFKSKR
jgi:hypothetical protein